MDVGSEQCAWCQFTEDADGEQLAFCMLEVVREMTWDMACIMREDVKKCPFYERYGMKHMEGA